MLRLLGLGKGIPRTRDLALIAIENRQLKTGEDRSRVLSRSVGKVEGAVNIDFAVGLRQANLALGSGYTEQGSLKIGTPFKRFSLQVLKVRVQRLIRQVTEDVVVGGHRIVSKKLPQADQRLRLCQPGGGHVGLELQQLKFDLEVVTFADGAGLELNFGNIDRRLEAFQIRQSERQRRFGQQDADKLLSHVKSEGALGVRDLSAGDRGLILRGLQPALPFVTAFKEIRQPDVELLGQIQILGGKIAGRKNGDELSIASEDRIGTQVGGNLLRLVLEDQSARGFERMVVG